MKLPVSIIAILVVQACSTDPGNQAWTELAKNYTHSATEIKNYHLNHIRQKNYESRIKMKDYHDAALSIDSIAEHFILICSKKDSKELSLEYHYQRAIKSIDSISKPFDVFTNSTYVNIPSTQNIRELLSLNILLCEIEILQEFHHRTTTSIYDYTPFDITISESQINNHTIRLDMQNEGFQSISKKYLSIDSIMTSNRRITTGEQTKLNHTFFSIYIDSLQPGTYKIFGSVTGFIDNSKVTERFEKEFKIKTGGNNGQSQP